MVRDERRTEQLKRDLEAKDRRIADLKSREAQRVADRQQRRREISEQVRLLREQEVTGLRESDGAGRQSFHPHYGLLMAEAWRVLRAQLARGERIPAAEHDAFFFQVVDELLEPDDFEGRYFHGKGRKAIPAVNQYLGGREPLRDRPEDSRSSQARPDAVGARAPSRVQRPGVAGSLAGGAPSIPASPLGRLPIRSPSAAGTRPPAPPGAEARLAVAGRVAGALG